MIRRATVELFVSYSHKDKTWFGRLQPLLKFNMPTGLAHAWHDQELKAGERWDDEIRVALENMHVFVCLVSYDFLASDFIVDVELKRALARETKKEIEVVPILLYPMNLEAECPELHAFNPLPAWGKCWMDYEQDTGHYQAAHRPIRDGLRQAIEKVKVKRKPKRR